jgi:hypothetical protein
MLRGTLKLHLGPASLRPRHDASLPPPTKPSWVFPLRSRQSHADRRQDQSIVMRPSAQYRLSKQYFTRLLYLRPPIPLAFLVCSLGSYTEHDEVSTTTHVVFAPTARSCAQAERGWQDAPIEVRMIRMYLPRLRAGKCCGVRKSPGRGRACVRPRVSPSRPAPPSPPHAVLHLPRTVPCSATSLLLPTRDTIPARGSFRTVSSTSTP